MACENLLKMRFKDNFELVKGSEFFRGDLHKMELLFKKTVIEFDNKFIDNIEEEFNLMNDINSEKTEYKTVNINTFSEVEKNNDGKSKMIEMEETMKINGKKFYCCKKCGKKFTRKENLIYHLTKSKIKCDEDTMVKVNGKKNYPVKKSNE